MANPAGQAPPRRVDYHLQMIRLSLDVVFNDLLTNGFGHPIVYCAGNIDDAVVIESSFALFFSFFRHSILLFAILLFVRDAM